MTLSRRLLAAAAVVTLVTTAGCLGDIRSTSTPRIAREKLLLSTAAQQGIAHVDSKTFRGKRIFLDTERLASIDKPYVEGAFRQRISEGGGRLTLARDAADLVVEARSGGLACWDAKWVVMIPFVYGAGLAPPQDASDVPSEIDIGYTLHEGWAHFQAFVYDAHTNQFVTGWRGGWGRSHVGFFDDIYPESGIGETVEATAK